MSTLVTTRAGKLEGEQLSNQIVFRGIPFAAPPVGPLRWLPPAPAPSWSGVRAAREFGNASLQPKIDLMMPWSVGTEASEDCLYLNVWTPATDAARRPVMVWIHGGAFQFGSGEEMMPVEQTLVSRGDVVLVTVNYRLGPLGFLNLSEVTGGAIPSSGNEGLLDQVAALEWIRDNIEAFGGDPQNVTIFGESAGGMSVGGLLALPAASGLFHKAIPQSGACHTANTPTRITNIGERVVELVGSDKADAFRALRPEELYATQIGICGEAEGGEAAWHPDPAIGSQPFQPCIDGTVLPDLPFHGITKGIAAEVPVLVGTTLDEAKAFAYAEPSLDGLDEERIRKMQGHLPGLDDLIVAYRDVAKERGTPHEPLDLFAAIVSDKQFRIPAVRLAEAQSAHQPRTFNYLYTWPAAVMDGAMGATHTVELGPLFGVGDLNDDYSAFFGSGPELERVTERTQLAWTSFARTGDPSCEAVGDWPAYDASRRATMMLGKECVIEDAPYDEERVAWESVPDGAIGEH